MCTTTRPATFVCCFVLLGALASRSVHATKTLLDSTIAGRRAPCSNEGEPVQLAGEGMSCYPCICKNGFVECKEPVCPAVEDCYMVMPREGCCTRCKGCWFNGTEHDSHTEWSDGAGRLLRCEAGVLTVSRPECYVPCAHPVRTRHTHYDCPVCNDCLINGQRVSEGREVTIPEDPCLKCRCSKGGLTCAKRACAVLACPPHTQHTRPGDCCPRCLHATAAKILPGHNLNKPCIMGKDYHAHSSAFTVDHCTSCKCVNGTPVCERHTCPVVTCDASALLPPAPGRCCPRCPVVEEVKTACVVGRNTYEDGQTWQWDACKSCECHAGEPRCAMERCPPLECAPDQQPRKIPGQCCAKCVDSDGVCTVFGDPHYKTFDGKFYSFQGSCKYQLVADCANDTFSIRISNDARSTPHSSWTRTVALRMGATKINLGRRLRVKVDGRLVRLPYELSDGRATVARSGDTVTVKASIGVELLWDGDGFLEVTASSAYRGRLCGLCGNFNSVARDDLTARDGRALADPWRFGSSWRVGGRKACTRDPERPAPARCRAGRAGRRARRLCRGLERLDAFSGCVAKLNPHNYRAACVRDACGCGPRGQCHCASFRAYARECRRLGAEPGPWTAAAWCEGSPPPWLRGAGAAAGGGGGGGAAPGSRERARQEERLRMSVQLAAGATQVALRPRPRPPPPILQ